MVGRIVNRVMKNFFKKISNSGLPFPWPLWPMIRILTKSFYIYFSHNMFGRPIASSRGDSVRNGSMAKLKEEYFNSRFKFQSNFKFHVFLHLFRFHQIVRSHHLNPTQSYILQCPGKFKLHFTLFNRFCFFCVTIIARAGSKGRTGQDN